MHRTLLPCLVALALLARGTARAGEPATPADPGAPTPPVDPAPDPTAPAAGARGELIEITGSAPAPAGAIALDGQVARRTAGALGEPLRALALLPGVTTSIAAVGYPIIRGTLPGESRYTFDGIEIPMLYHLLLGNQVIHPAFIGDLELRAGGHGAEHGQLLGGLISITPAADTERTELHVNLVEAGGFRAQRLSKTTSIAAAARVGTLAGAVKIYDSDAALYSVDQQTRLVHRLGNGDELTLTSLGAFDHVRLPSIREVRTVQLGFHRLDARWSRERPGGGLRAGIQTEFDTLRSVTRFARLPSLFPEIDEPPPRPPVREGGRSYGVRAYGDGELRLAHGLTLRAGLEAHHRTLVHRAPVFSLTDAFTEADDPFLGQADAVDSQAAWSALDLRIGRFTITPGIRGDSYHVDMPDVSVRHGDVDPRLAIAAELPGGGRAELAGGRYSAPPQVSVIDGPIAIGPLPMTEGTAALAGLSRSTQAQVSLRVPLGAGWQGSFAAYHRDTDYAVDFGMIDKPFTSHELCIGDKLSQTLVYRHVEVRAMGVEAMVRRDLGRSVTGWLSYSLGKIDRDLGFIRLPHDYDQRHTLAASAQWRRGAWLLGASAQLHTGRPAVYPHWRQCSPATPGFSATYDVLSEPTHLRRLPMTWRVDLRAEREYRFSDWNLRLYVEIQNASLTKEVLSYDLARDFDPPDHVTDENTLFIPLPIFGLEVAR